MSLSVLVMFLSLHVSSCLCPGLGFRQINLYSKFSPLLNASSSINSSINICEKYYYSLQSLPEVHG